MNTPTGRETGTVKWFSRDKGWGFIRRANGDEIFVHHSDIVGEGHVSLVDDETVEFGVEEMEKGPRAREVRPLGDDSARGDPGRDSGDLAAVKPPPPTESPDPGGLNEMLRRRLADRFPDLFDA